MQPSAVRLGAMQWEVPQSPCVLISEDNEDGTAAYTKVARLRTFSAIGPPLCLQICLKVAQTDNSMF